MLGFLVFRVKERKTFRLVVVVVVDDHLIYNPLMVLLTSLYKYKYKYNKKRKK